MTRTEVETALDNGKLWVRMTRGRGPDVWWKLRRNGKTQTWKRDPERFRIPTKAGLYAFGEITEGGIKEDWFRISETKPT